MRPTRGGGVPDQFKTKGVSMKRTMIATMAAVATVLAAAYLTGADGTAASAPQMGMAGTPGGTIPANRTMTSAQQVMQAPALETEECTEGYILLMPCPVCHTCPVCQANCGTAHALKCCLGNKKPTFNSSGAASGGQTTGGASGTQTQHIMTNKAEAVKHAAGHSASAQQPQTDSAVLSIYSIETD